MNSSQNSAGRFRIRLLLGILVGLVTVDGIITQFLIKGGLAGEGNPLLKSVVGEHIFVPLKLLGAVLAAFIFWDVYRRLPRLAVIVTSSCAALYAAIVLWNVAVFLISQPR